MQRLSKIAQQLIQPNPFQKYRNNSKIAKQDFTEGFFGPNWSLRTNQINFMMKNIQKFPHFHLTQSNRSEQRMKSIQLMKFVYNNKQISAQDIENSPNKLTLLGNPVYAYNPGFSVKNGVHIYLYTKTLYILGTQKHKQLLDKAQAFKQIGCFALTELLHGSNVKGILTEAHYDHQKRQIIIHSPSRDAMKFWIGAAANLANIAVVWAQLFIDKKCYGVHCFVVPLRDPNTHDILPGITVGDCGDKNGLNEIDNGFILFDRVRIPVTNLLDRLSGIDQNGKFFNTLQTQQKRFGVQLGALSGGRVNLSISSVTLAVNALAIGVRYAAVRKQFGPPGKQEISLLQYPLTKYRLMPLLAQTIVYLSCGLELAKKWDDNSKQLLNPNNQIISQIHAISSTTKSQSSWFTSSVISECRQIMGGHGYSAYSRLGNLYHANDVNITWEGDNSILLQQTGKFVLETYQQMMKGKQIQYETLKFLHNVPTLGQITDKNLRSLDFIEIIFQNRLLNKIQDSGMRLLQLKMKKVPLFDIWNGSQVHFIYLLALNFGDLFYLQSSRKILQNFKDQNNRNFYEKCILLWAFKTLQKQGYGNEDVKELIQSLVVEYCQLITSEAIPVLDVLAIPSELIGSPFADQNGQGIRKYLNLIWTGKDTFRKVDWWQTIVNKSK